MQVREFKASALQKCIYKEWCEVL